jgi:uncharacterized protein
MTNTVDYEFDWDDTKAQSNLKDHKVDFNDAMTVLKDPLAITSFDEGHSDDEERWITVGNSSTGQLLLVVHTFTSLSATSALVRIISAREPTKRERQHYEQSS